MRSQAEDEMLLKGVLIAFLTEYMFTFDVVKMNLCILFDRNYSIHNNTGVGTSACDVTGISTNNLTRSE